MTGCKQQTAFETLKQAISNIPTLDYSEKDPEIQKLKAGLYHNNWDEEVKTCKLFQTELCFYEKILLRGIHIVTPKDLRKTILEADHEGHPGIVAMKARLRAKVWWPKYDKEAEKLVKSCAGCTLVSAPNPPNPLKRRELPDEAWKDVAIDLLGPLSSGDHILVIVDYFSRYKEVKIDSTEMIKHLTEIFSCLSDPATITADNGRQFISKETANQSDREKRLEISLVGVSKNVQWHSTFCYRQNTLRAIFQATI